MARLSMFALTLMVFPTLIISAAVGDDSVPHKAHDRVLHAKDLSDKEHYDAEGEHESDYDHEAFLGGELAEEFDKLTPDESVRRLGVIVDRIDTVRHVVKFGNHL